MRGSRAGLVLLLAGGSASACGNPAGDSVEPNVEEEPVCPFCEPSAGGQTSDFDGGSKSICELFLKREPATEVRGHELDIDLTRARGLLTRDLDLPLHWRLGDLRDSGAVVEGFDQDARVIGNTEVVSQDALTLDAALCDGATCESLDGDWQAPQEDCLDTQRLETRFVARLRSSDGAIEAELVGDALHYSNVAFPFGSALADINDVRGSLRLRVPDDGSSHFARLRADVSFHEDRLEGVLAVDLVVKRSPGVASQYVLLTGYWPDVPTEPPAAGAGIDLGAEP